MNPSTNRSGNRSANGSAQQSRLVCILTDPHLWVPVVVLILGTTLLMTLR